MARDDDDDDDVFKTPIFKRDLNSSHNFYLYKVNLYYHVLTSTSTVKK